MLPATSTQFFALLVPGGVELDGNTPMMVNVCEEFAGILNVPLQVIGVAVGMGVHGRSVFVIVIGTEVFSLITWEPMNGHGEPLVTVIVNTQMLSTAHVPWLVLTTVMSFGGYLSSTVAQSRLLDSVVS